MGGHPLPPAERTSPASRRAQWPRRTNGCAVLKDLLQTSPNECVLEKSLRVTDSGCGDSPDADLPCMICLEPLREFSAFMPHACGLQALPCGHTFHIECIRHWLSTSPTCPLCKIDVA